MSDICVIRDCKNKKNEGNALYCLHHYQNLQKGHDIEPNPVEHWGGRCARGTCNKALVPGQHTLGICCGGCRNGGKCDSKCPSKVFTGSAVSHSTATKSSNTCVVRGCSNTKNPGNSLYCLPHFTNLDKNRDIEPNPLVHFGGHCARQSCNRAAISGKHVYGFCCAGCKNSSAGCGSSCPSHVFTAADASSASSSSPPPRAASTTASTTSTASSSPCSCSCAQKDKTIALLKVDVAKHDKTIATLTQDKKHLDAEKKTLQDKLNCKTNEVKKLQQDLSQEKHFEQEAEGEVANLKKIIQQQGARLAELSQKQQHSGSGGGGADSVLLEERTNQLKKSEERNTKLEERIAELEAMNHKLTMKLLG